MPYRLGAAADVVKDVNLAPGTARRHVLRAASLRYVGQPGSHCGCME